MRSMRSWASQLRRAVVTSVGLAQRPNAPPLGCNLAEWSLWSSFQQTERQGRAHMLAGLPKHQLKEIWDKVAGAQGFLTKDQFLRAYALIDAAKAGHPGAGISTAGYAPAPRPDPTAGLASIVEGIPEGMRQPPESAAFSYTPGIPSSGTPGEHASLTATEKRQLEVAEERAKSAERAFQLEQHAVSSMRWVRCERRAYKRCRAAGNPGRRLRRCAC